nr:uncharacterized protein LOC123569049 [Macaca fascicularis]
MEGSSASVVTSGHLGHHRPLTGLRVKRTFYQNVSSPAAFFWPLYSVRNGNFQLSAPTMCLASSFCECVCPVAVGKGLCCVHCPRGSHCPWAPALPGSLVPPDRMPEPQLRSELCTSPSVARLGSHSPGTSEQLGGCIRPSPPCWAGGSCPRVGGAGEGGGGASLGPLDTGPAGEGPGLGTPGDTWGRVRCEDRETLLQLRDTRGRRGKARGQDAGHEGEFVCGEEEERGDTVGRSGCWGLAGATA